MGKRSTLDSLKIGREALVTGIQAEERTRERLMALGFLPGGTVKAEMESMWGDPVAYRVCGAVIALRRRDARAIGVEFL